MKLKYFAFLVFFFFTTAFIPKAGTKWLIKKHREYRLFYTAEDRKYKRDYASIIDNGIKLSREFFNYPFVQKFDVFVHPNRESLDSTWRRDWNLPGFKSECWMVASGIGEKLDILSPVQWDKHACEHSYTDSKKTQQLVAHELIHVYHGQVNASHDFSDVEGIDWFVEGLATYASGQYDSIWMERITEAIKQNEIPATLDSFWMGKHRYGLSGSVVMFLDHQYGRDKIKELMSVSRKAELLSSLGTDEPKLLAGWKSFVQSR